MRNLSNLSDERLVELVRKQDQEIYREIVNRYQEKLVRYAQYLIKDEDKAIDVVQEAFIKAFINLKGFNTKKKFSSWIYRIVHNEAINYLKKYAKEISLDDNQWIEETVESATNVEEEFDKKELREMLNFCLNDLPLKYREPLILFYLEDKSYEEISDILKMSIGTVGTRINRGKKLLAVICKKRGGEVYA